MSDFVSNPLLELIKERNLLDDLQIQEVVQEHVRSGKPLGQVLQDFGLIDSDTQLQLIADHLGTEVVELRDREITPDILASIPPDTAKLYQAMPVAIFGSTIQVALADPLNPATIDELGF